MKPIEIPEFPRLRGEKAIKALHDFVSELEERRSEELTDKQSVALIKVAKELIFSLEAEKQASIPSREAINGVRFASGCEKTIEKYPEEKLRLFSV